MKNLDLSLEASSDNFFNALRAAADRARERFSEPVIIAWKDDQTGLFGPEVPAAGDDRWHAYGENNNGLLQVNVDGKYHFIFTESEEFAQSDNHVETLAEDGDSGILCLRDACTEEDKRKLGSFAGSVGG